MTKDQKRDPRTEAPTAQLTEDQLEQAAGGTTNVQHTIVSPRDPASGLPKQLSIKLDAVGLTSQTRVLYAFDKTIAIATPTAPQ